MYIASDSLKQLALYVLHDIQSAYFNLTWQKRIRNWKPTENKYLCFTRL